MVESRVSIIYLLDISDYSDYAGGNWVKREVVILC